MREDMAQLLHDLVFGMRPGDRQLLHEEVLRRIEHLALAKGQLLIALQDKEVAQYFGDLKDRPGLDLFGVFAIAAVPGLLIAFDFLLAEDFINLGDHVAVDDFSEAYGVDVVDGDHDFHVAVQNAQHVKSFFGAGDDLRADRLDLPDAVRGVDYLLADFEHGSLLEVFWAHPTVGTPGIAWLKCNSITEEGESRRANTTGSRVNSSAATIRLTLFEMCKKISGHTADRYSFLTVILSIHSGLGSVKRRGRRDYEDSN